MRDKINLNENIINGNYFFSECSWESVKHLFLIHHYLKTMPAGIMAVYGIFDQTRLNIAIGGAVFCNGRIQYENKYIEFSRMFIYDFLGKNSESWFIGKCIKNLKNKFPKYDGIVTWSDSNKGHIGTIYLASNFIYDGESRKVKKFKGKDKKVIYQRTAKKGDIEIGEDLPKKRFIYYFNSKKRELLRNA